MGIKSLARNVSHICSQGRWFLWVALNMLLVFSSIKGHERNHRNDCAELLAKNLVTHFWKDVQRQDIASYSSKVASNFQGLSLAGHDNKASLIAGLSKITLEQLTLKNIKAVKYEKTLVVSYDLLAKGSNVSSGPNIDVWHQCKSQWKLISHSYVPFQ